MGTLGGALEARGIPTGGRLFTDVTGEIEKTDDSVLYIKSIHASYVLYVDRLDDEISQKVDRVMGFHIEKCPVARTVMTCIDISTQIELIEGAST